VGGGRAYFGRGMRQRPSTLLRFPCTMVLLLLVIMTFSCDKASTR